MQTHIALDQRLRLCCVAGSSAVSQHMRPDSAIGYGTYIAPEASGCALCSIGVKYFLTRNETCRQSFSITSTSASLPC